jgi:hypothetical protein
VDPGLSLAEAWTIAARHLARTGRARMAEATRPPFAQLKTAWINLSHIDYRYLIENVGYFGRAGEIRTRDLLHPKQ